jgi:hypothetical protein
LGVEKNEPVDARVGHGGLLDHAVGRVGHEDADVGGVGDRQLVQTIVGGTPGDPDTDAELADCSAHDGEPVMAAKVGHADVTPITLRAGGDRRAVAVNGVAVEIQGDVVGTDHDAVVGAVDQVAVQGRVGGNGVAAAHVACQRRASTDHREAGHHQGEDHHPGQGRLMG